MTISFRPAIPPKLPRIGIRIESMTRFQAADVAALECDEITDRQRYRETHAEWLHMIQTPCIRCLVVKHGKGLIIGGLAFHAPVNEPIYEVFRLIVGSAFRRHGVGRALITEVISHLGRRSHRHTVEVIVPEYNDPAVAFFADLGFRGVTVLRKFYDDVDRIKIDGWVMQYQDGEHKHNHNERRS